MYVAFDIGNVLAHCDFHDLIEIMSNYLSIDKARALKLLNELHINHDLGLTHLELEFAKLFGSSKTELIHNCLSQWEKSIKFEPLMIEFLNQLYCDGFHIALLSNIGIEHAALVDKVLGTEKFYEFSAKWFSCEQVVRKPNLDYYKSFLTHHPEFQECVYFDDLPHNLDAGLKCGLKPHKLALTDYFHSRIPTTLSDQPIYDYTQERPQDKINEFKAKLLETKEIIYGNKTR